MFIKHSLSLLIAFAASCMTYHIFESTFDNQQGTEGNTVAISNNQKSDYISGGADENCTWIAVTVNEPIQCFANPVPMSYGPPSQFLLSKASTISTVSTELCDQISHLQPAVQGGAKALLEKPVKWICPINQFKEGA